MGSSIGRALVSKTKGRRFDSCPTSKTKNKNQITMNTTDYFTNINAMFLFCIFTCGLLVWAVISRQIKVWKLQDEQEAHLKATKINSLLTKENKEINDKLAESEHKLRDAEKEIRELQSKLDHAEADRIELRAERATLENKLTDALAKVRKRDKDGKFLPSGNARPKRVKKVKGETDALRAFDEMMGSPIEQLDAMTIKPKLVHGLTVKNPTDDEAKMIFDEAKRLGLSTYAEHRIDLPFIWWSVTDTVSRCADSDWPVEQIFVTAKEFVQRMQNGRG